jgi:hypothetical protein
MTSQEMGTESYRIVFRFRDDEGFWRQDTTIMDGYHRKDDHEQAIKDFLDINPDADILNVIYQ